MLAADAVEEMWFPQVMYYPHDWVLGWGLGLMLYNQDGAIYGGHGGAMAGHLAGVYIDRKTQTGAAALTNSGTRGDMELFAIIARGEGEASCWPPAIEPWQPGGGAAGRGARAARPLVVGGERVRLLVGGRHAAGEGRRQRRPAVARRRSSATATAGAPPRGRERGERLRVDGDQLIWAGYAFTRAQEPFKACSSRSGDEAYATTASAVDADEQEALPAARAAVPDRRARRTAAAAAIVTISITRNESGRPRPTSHESRQTAGVDEDARPASTR